MNSSINNSKHSPAYQHAIVIGGSIAGMTSARVLSDYFAQVTVIERDLPPSVDQFRTGVPQARHPHALLARGQQLLEAMFPGLVNDLVREGATPLNFGRDLGLFIKDAWCQPTPSTIMTTVCSRPLLEHTIYQHLATRPNVRFLHQQEVLGLVADAKGEVVTGIRLRNRQQPATSSSVTVAPQQLSANLVVDASGRGSRAPEWLSALGYQPPTEEIINAFVGYSTRIYRKPANFAADWKALYLLTTYPDRPRGALLLPMEGDRWHTVLVGINGDYPPTDEEGFLGFARSLPSSRFYDAIIQAEPLTAPYGYRQAENRLRHYEKLPRYLENFLVTGDAVYAFNPVYGQGMSTAALVSQTLAECLQTQRSQYADQSLMGLARRFQKQLAGVIADPWQLATGQDIRWPKTEGGKAPAPITRLVQRYLDRVLLTLPHNPAVAEGFFFVQNMLKPAASLLHPKIMWQVLKPQTRRVVQPTMPQRLEESYV